MENVENGLSQLSDIEKTKIEKLSAEEKENTIKTIKERFKSPNFIGNYFEFLKEPERSESGAIEFSIKWFNKFNEEGDRASYELYPNGSMDRVNMAPWESKKMVLRPLEESYPELVPLLERQIEEDKIEINDNVSHDHFRALYREVGFGMDEKGAIYIYPDKIKNRLTLAGRGELEMLAYYDLPKSKFDSYVSFDPEYNPADEEDDDVEDIQEQDKGKSIRW